MFVASCPSRRPMKHHAAGASPRNSGANPKPRLRQPSLFRRRHCAPKAPCGLRPCRGRSLTARAVPDPMARDCHGPSTGSAAFPEPAGRSAQHRILSPWMYAIYRAAEARFSPTIEGSARLPKAAFVYATAGTCDLCILTRDFEEASSCRTINSGFCVAHRAAQPPWRPLTPGLKP